MTCSPWKFAAARWQRALIALVLFSLLTGSAQNTRDIVLRNFRIAPDHYPPPNERQIKSLLEGATAQPLPGNNRRVTEATLRTFQTNGTVELQVNTPECIWVEAEKAVRSAAPVAVRAAQGKFLLEGVGFSWEQTNSTLFISNRVRTVVAPELLKTAVASGVTGGAAIATNGIVITSDSFSYSKLSGLGVYESNVHLVGTNLFLNSGELIVRVPFSEHEVESISARTNVVLEYADLHATGEAAVFSVASGLLEVSGNPAWQNQSREGHADLIVADRANQVFDARGNAYLKLTGIELASVQLPNSPRQSTNSVNATNKWVEIHCADYQIRTNAAVFRETVRAVDSQGGFLNCDLLSLSFTGTNQLQRMQAEGGVAFGRQDRRFTGQTAVYEGTNSLLVITGNPAWIDGERQGHGQRIEADLGANRVAVRGDAYMQLPGRQLGEAAASPLGRGVSTDLFIPNTNAIAEVRCSEYETAPGWLRFSGGVQISHPQIKWTCERFTVYDDEKGGGAQKAIAEPPVTFTLIDKNGQPLLGIADTAVYTRRVVAGRTNATIELTGAPASLQTTNGFRVENRVLVLDLISSSFIVPPGGYRITGPPLAAATVLTPAVFRSPYRAARGPFHEQEIHQN